MNSVMLTVRGRPVEFQGSRFFGSLHAVERGHFPISSTGYRSLAGMHHIAKDIPEAEHCDLFAGEFLENLAKEQEAELQKAKRLLKCDPMRGEGSTLGSYIFYAADAQKAFQCGLFSTDADRHIFWPIAYSLYAKIDRDPAFQPSPKQLSRWSIDDCMKALATTRREFLALKKMMRGIVPEFSCPHILGLNAYLALPARNEPLIAFPTIETEFALSLSSEEISHGSDEAIDDDAEEDFEDQEADDAELGNAIAGEAPAREEQTLLF